MVEGSRRQPSPIFSTGTIVPYPERIAQEVLRVRGVAYGLGAVYDQKRVRRGGHSLFRIGTGLRRVESAVAVTVEAASVARSDVFPRSAQLPAEFECVWPGGARVADQEYDWEGVDGFVGYALTGDYEVEFNRRWKIWWALSIFVGDSESDLKK